MERLSLAQQIAQLEDVAPVDLDPEDIQVTGIDPDLDPDLAIAADISTSRAHYFDVGPSSLRKLHDSLSDPKYDGAKTSRKLILDESDNCEDDSASDDAESGSRVSEVRLEIRTVNCETGENRKVDECIRAEALPTAPTQNGDLSASLRNTREEDRKKGKAISRQIASQFPLELSLDLYLASRLFGTPSLMLASACRNQSQLETASPLRIAANEQVHTSLVKMLEEAQLLSNEIFDFQERLLSANESIQPPPRKRRRGTETEYSVVDYAEELREAGRATSELEYAYHSHLVQTLNKWSSKIQAVAPLVLLPANRNAFSRTAQHIKSAPQLIDETLMDHNKMLSRTRIYRGKGSRLGISEADEDGIREKEDSEMFDDTDFYHQLLRDIIDTRGHGMGRNDDWIAVQREKRAKKKVDTKASKGRKLRYEVHEKIQNFMVPVLTQGGWHEEQSDELFASLLGKGFESAMQEVGETVDESLQEEVNAALQGGFRVFG